MLEREKLLLLDIHQACRDMGATEGSAKLLPGDDMAVTPPPLLVPQDQGTRVDIGLAGDLESSYVLSPLPSLGLRTRSMQTIGFV